MVYFTCDACGEQLKKPSVEKHYQQKCRDCYKLTCIDCLKDFYGDEYQSHNSCMSEDQRYSKEGRSGWDPSKGQGHKGEKKQNAWVNNLRAILAETQDLDSDVKTIVNTIMDHENIPRKKPKFINFVKNIMRNRARPHSIDKTWELFSQALKTPEPQPEAKTEVTEETKMEVTEDKPTVSDEVVEASEKKKKKKKKNKEASHSKESTEETASEKENVEEVKPKKKGKNKEHSEEKNLKRKRSEDMEVDDDEEDASVPLKKKKFDWEETMTNVLMKKEGHEMKLNKLKKKCVNEFLGQNEGTHKTPEELGAKFDKKLKKRKFRVLKDRVKLILEDEEETTSEEKNKTEVVSTDEVVSSQKVEKSESAKSSFNNWEAANLGSSTQNEKFRRLMGIKTTSTSNGKFGGANRNDQKIFRDLEKGFERARQTHFGGRCFET